MTEPLDPAIAARQARTLQRWIVFALHGIMLVGIAAALWQQQWFTALVSLGIVILALTPMMLTRRLDVFVPPELELPAVLFIFASLYLGDVSGYYTRFWWWDLVLHTGSGLLLGHFGFLLVYVLNRVERIDLSMKPGFVSLFAFSFAVATGALWEIFEFGLDEIFGADMQHGSLHDTMWDLIVDTVGAGAITAVSYLYLRRGAEFFASRWIRRFVDANPRLFRRERA